MKAIVMEGRRRWIIGAGIGLSKDYVFVGGQAVEVPDEDAAILLDATKTDSHAFVLADDPAAAAVLADAEARAADHRARPEIVGGGERRNIIMRGVELSDRAHGQFERSVGAQVFADVPECAVVARIDLDRRVVAPARQRAGL